MSNRVIIDELEVEVPYGKLFAKTWHEETDECKRILVLHGWMDNAGSFDNLVPKLKYKDGLYVVALDLPGHGKSAQIPAGSAYSDLGIVMEIRRCLLELEWTQTVPKKSTNGQGNSDGHRASQNDINSMEESSEPKKKFTIIGHSLGAGLGVYYASLYPNDVDEIIVLDFIKPKTKPVLEVLQNTADSIDQFIEIVPSRSLFYSPTLKRSNVDNRISDKGQVVVSQEAAIIATIEAHKQLGLLSRDDATCLLKRSTIAVNTPPNGVLYSRDLRLQAMLNLRDNFEFQKTMYSGMKCHLLIILGKQGMYNNDRDFLEYMDEIEEFYRSHAKTVHLEWLDGDHYVHMNRSKEVADIVNKYLEKPDGYKIGNSP